jgi:hypothetical protein
MSVQNEGLTTMSGSSARPTDPSIRALSRDLSAARDKKLADAVALVDALPERGAADELIEPLRTRLAGMHLRRPLSFCRLLFTPLDPLVVPAPRWRPALATLPRSVLLPFAETVRTHIDAVARPIEALIKGRSLQDVDVVNQAGARLWPEAGRILMQSPPPVGWDQTGLNPTIYKQLSRRIGAVLLQITTLDALAEDTALGSTVPDRDRIVGIMRAVADLEPDATPMMAVILLARLPQAGSLLDETRLRNAGQQAVELLMEQLEAPGSIEAQLAHGDLTHAADAVRRIGMLLRGVEANGAPALRARMTALRRRLDEHCRARFASSLGTDLVDKLTGQAAVSAAVDDLEESARGLRTFETEARGFGGGGSYDQLLRQVAETVRGLPADGGLEKAERVRLVELLAGPDMALAMCRLGE